MFSCLLFVFAMQYHCHIFSIELLQVLIFCCEDGDFEAEALSICAKIGRWPSNIAPFDGKSTEHMLKLNGMV